ncbi:gastrula zinc finger protein xlcgf46.1: PROVISIONAL [Gigaspora margarita]|uniref:Gastrula zinc finger protein xlcgf46.1: PROVISIONAL n=1 Tax=Gigaspora margarita TaxID=4874 RepID=A0A8H4B2K9_GIGMA|nr:gastrula zinc finger protein xlcgf46.1: PROVISIONAL [Gigaspora margarita]
MSPPRLPNQNPILLANPEIEFLNALRLFDPSEIAKTISLPEAKRKCLEALGILEPIPQFHQTDIISSRCELLDDHYKVEIEKESIYAQDPINTLGGLFDDKIEEDNREIDYKEVPFKNKLVVVTAKEDILRIVDKLIWDIENRIKTYIVEEDLYSAPYHRERTQNQNSHLDELNFKRIQFPVKADNNIIEKFEKQNLSISVSIYGWSEKELIPIRIASKSKLHNRCNHKEGNCQPCKLIRLLLITGDDPKTREPSQHYCLIQGREGLGKLARFMTKHNGRCSDGKTKALVKIRGDDPAKEFIKAIEKEVEQCQDFLAGGHIIQNSAKKLIKMLQSGIIPEEIAEDYITSINIFQSWELGKINLNFSKEYEKLILLKHYLKGLYQAYKRDPLGVDIGIIYCLANTIYCRLRWPGEPMKKLTTQEEKMHNLAKECWICKKTFGKEDNLKKV